jgi:hypothetical protein
MRIPCIAACLALLMTGAAGCAALAQSAEVAAPGVPPATAAPTGQPDQFVPPPAGNGTLRIEWEVRNRFRLFRNESDFKRHLAAYSNDGVLGAEERLARASDGWGWAKDMVDHLCVDRAGNLLETCERDGQREVYMAPQDHPVVAVLAGAVPKDATCAWTFDDGNGPARQAQANCGEDMRARVAYGRPTVVTVDVTLADGTSQRVTSEILVRDLLIAGLGDSIASGEGNPDRAVKLDDEGFCYRRFGGGTRQYYRPGRAGFRGDKSCETGVDRTVASDGAGGVGAAGAAGGSAATEWRRHAARWMSAACHRSLYGYQLRTALALAIENPHVAVTFLPLACSGAGVGGGLFGTQYANECGDSGKSGCSGRFPGQIAQLERALAIAKRHGVERSVDLLLLTVGANDVLFSGLVADVIIDPSSTERVLFKQAGLIDTTADAIARLDRLPTDFAKLRAALKPFVGGDLARVEFVSYGNPALQAADTPCPGGRLGFDIHPAFNVDAERLKHASEFVSTRFLPRLVALARCENGVICDGDTDRMTFVDGHQAAFAQHGFCAQAETDPAFDRDCFSAQGESFEPDIAKAATDPLVCEHTASEFRPYASRARWIRTANDSYFTAMTYPEGRPGLLQPSDVHDATWGVTSAVYGGAIHPTAEGHAAMADAALPAARAILGLPEPATVTSEPLPPPPSVSPTSGQQ